MTEEQHERLRAAYARHRAGEMTREEFEAWCSGFWAVSYTHLAALGCRASRMATPDEGLATLLAPRLFA